MCVSFLKETKEKELFPNGRFSGCNLMRQSSNPKQDQFIRNMYYSDHDALCFKYSHNSCSIYWHDSCLIYWGNWLKSLSWFLRLSPSCARGGRPTLATALVFLKFAVSYPTKEPSSRVFAFSIRIPRCRVDQEQTSQCDLLSWRQKRAWNEEGYCNDHRKFCIDYGYISSTD